MYINSTIGKKQTLYSQHGILYRNENKWAIATDKNWVEFYLHNFEQNNPGPKITFI